MFLSNRHMDALSLRKQLFAPFNISSLCRDLLTPNLSINIRALIFSLFVYILSIKQFLFNKPNNIGVWMYHICSDQFTHELLLNHLNLFRLLETHSFSDFTSPTNSNALNEVHIKEDLLPRDLIVGNAGILFFEDLFKPEKNAENRDEVLLGLGAENRISEFEPLIADLVHPKNHPFFIEENKAHVLIRLDLVHKPYDELLLIENGVAFKAERSNAKILLTVHHVDVLIGVYPLTWIYLLRVIVLQIRVVLLMVADRHQVLNVLGPKVLRVVAQEALAGVRDVPDLPCVFFTGGQN